MPYFAAFSLSTFTVKDGVVSPRPSSTSTVPSVFSTTSAICPASFCSLSKSFPLTRTEIPLPKKELISDAELSVFTSQSRSAVSACIEAVISLPVAPESSMSTYMVTLSVLPPIDMIPPPPAMAPIESTPEMPEILSTTSSARSVSSSNVSFSSSFAETVTVSCSVSIFMSIKVNPLETESVTLATRKTTTQISTIGLNRSATRRTFSYPSKMRSNHGCLISLVFFSAPDAIIGTNVSATIRLAANV